MTNKFNIYLDHDTLIYDCHAFIRTITSQRKQMTLPYGFHCGEWFITTVQVGKRWRGILRNMCTLWVFGKVGLSAPFDKMLKILLHSFI